MLYCSYSFGQLCIISCFHQARSVGVLEDSAIMNNMDTQEQNLTERQAFYINCAELCMLGNTKTTMFAPGVPNFSKLIKKNNTRAQELLSYK